MQISGWKNEKMKRKCCLYVFIFFSLSPFLPFSLSFFSLGCGEGSIDLENLKKNLPPAVFRGTQPLDGSTITPDSAIILLFEGGKVAKASIKTSAGTGSGTVDIAQNRFIWKPDADLQPGSYNFEITWEDEAGNKGNKTVSFKVKPRPLTPGVWISKDADPAKIILFVVSPNLSYIQTFIREADGFLPEAGRKIQNISYKDFAEEDAPIVDDSFKYSKDADKFFFSGKFFSHKLAKGEWEGDIGGFKDRFPWEAIPLGVDPTPPKLVTSNPKDGEVGVSVEVTNLFLQFEERLSLTFPPIVSFKPPLPGRAPNSLIFSFWKDTITLAGGAKFDPNTKYEITYEARDMVGNRANGIITFTTK